MFHDSPLISNPLIRFFDSTIDLEKSIPFYLVLFLLGFLVFHSIYPFIKKFTGHIKQLKNSQKKNM